jgi:hypothetical protein
MEADNTFSTVMVNSSLQEKDMGCKSDSLATLPHPLSSLMAPGNEAAVGSSYSPAISYPYFGWIKCHFIGPGPTPSRRVY